jgi:hypothetical protein
MNPRTLPRLSALALACLAPTLMAAEKREIRFNRDIRPILSDNCFQCHGFDEKTRKADRRLDIREGALLEKEGIKAIVPGDLRSSEMHRRIHSEDADEVMPPPKNGKRISKEQRALLDEWIRQGAPYEPHWAYTPPSKVAVPANTHPVDHLIESRLATLGLRLSPEADKRTLARRAHADLTGLPPTPANVKSFEDDKSPDAFERLVDSLMASPHFGERMAIPWLDVVRFADTIGYHSDNPRNVWPYRDYVIKAFTENKRFDQFTIEQLAGDLLPNSTLEQKVASAFNRLLLTTEEGGAQAKDYEARMLTDRVRAVGTVWLAQTIGCAQCHDHKFDPISTRDFYTMGAFFADISEGIIGKREEGILVPQPAEEKKMSEINQQLASLRGDLATESEERRKQQADWEATLANGPTDVAWTAVSPEKLHADKGSQLNHVGNGIVEVGAANSPAGESYVITFKTPPGTTAGLKLDALRSESLPNQGPGRSPKGAFIINEITIKEGNTPLKISEASATYEAKAHPAKQAIDDKTDERNGWSNSGLIGKDASIYLEMATPISGEKTITVTLRQTSGDNQTLGRFRISATQTPAPIRAPNVQYPEDIIKAISLPTEKRTAAQNTKLAAHFRATAPQFAEIRQRISQTETDRVNFEKSVAHCIVSVHTDNKRTVRILPRGDWQNDTGEIVNPELPHYLPRPEDPGRPLTRLDLANWIVSRQNPLTARVFVNRLWKQFFGTGLSKVLDDLGTQGEPPMYAELLDWLACEFVDSGWDVKHMVRLLVTSRAYRQTSTASKDLLAKDPYNRELARQSRWRLDAEFVRDTALSVSGLLNAAIGGPSSKPYQPEGYWENLNFPARTYPNDTDSKQFRRGLYTWWQRSYVHPSMLAFDAPTREECTAERIRSNIPQQALVLLNDPTYVESARNLAARIVLLKEVDVSSRLAWAFAQVLQRNPTKLETDELTALYGKHVREFSETPSSAEALVKIGISERPGNAPQAELAAWTSIARVLLNLHETITRS